MIDNSSVDRLTNKREMFRKLNQIVFSSPIVAVRVIILRSCVLHTIAAKTNIENERVRSTQCFSEQKKNIIQTKKKSVSQNGPTNAIVREVFFYNPKNSYAVHQKVFNRMANIIRYIADETALVCFVRGNTHVYIV